jgi:hypothetical protein
METINVRYARGPLIGPTGEILVTARSERIYPRTEDRTGWTDRPTDRLGTPVGRSVRPALRGRFLVCLVPVHTVGLYRAAVGVPVDAEYGRPTDRQTTWVYLLMQSTADRPTADHMGVPVDAEYGRRTDRQTKGGTGGVSMGVRVGSGAERVMLCLGF